MDPEKLKQFADIQFERAAYIAVCRETAHANLTIAHNGGLFTVTPLLITFLSVCTDEQVFVEDNYNNPIKVNRAALLSQAKEIYNSVMEKWAADLDQSNKIRKADHV